MSKTMTVFIKRYPSKGELPEYGQRVIGLVLEQNDLGLSKFLWNVSYHEEEKKFFMDGDIVSIEYWLEKIELPNAEDIGRGALGPFKEKDLEDQYGDFIQEDINTFTKGANYILNHLKSK